HRPSSYDAWPTTRFFSPDGKVFLAQSDTGTIQLWSLTKRQPIGLPLVHNDRIDVATFSADSRTLLTASMRVTASMKNAGFGVRLWDTATGKPIGTPLERVWEATVISPDGQTVAQGGQLWKAATGEPLTTLRSPDPLHPRRGTFSPDGRTLLTLCE